MTLKKSFALTIDFTFRKKIFHLTNFIFNEIIQNHFTNTKHYADQTKVCFDSMRLFTEQRVYFNLLILIGEVKLFLYGDVCEIFYTEIL